MTSVSQSDLDQYIHRFGTDLIRDCLNQASAAYWARRADELEAGLSRAGDFPGVNPDPDQGNKIRAAVQACRAKALLLKRDGVQ